MDGTNNNDMKVCNISMDLYCGGNSNYNLLNNGQTILNSASSMVDRMEQFSTEDNQLLISVLASSSPFDQYEMAYPNSSNLLDIYGYTAKPSPLQFMPQVNHQANQPMPFNPGLDLSAINGYAQHHHHALLHYPNVNGKYFQEGHNELTAQPQTGVLMLNSSGDYIPLTIGRTNSQDFFNTIIPNSSLINNKSMFDSPFSSHLSNGMNSGQLSIYQSQEMVINSRNTNDDESYQESIQSQSHSQSQSLPSQINELFVNNAFSAKEIKNGKRINNQCGDGKSVCDAKIIQPLAPSGTLSSTDESCHNANVNINSPSMLDTNNMETSSQSPNSTMDNSDINDCGGYHLKPLETHANYNRLLPTTDPYYNHSTRPKSVNMTTEKPSSPTPMVPSIQNASVEAPNSGAIHPITSNRWILATTPDKKPVSQSFDKMLPNHNASHVTDSNKHHQSPPSNIGKLVSQVFSKVPNLLNGSSGSKTLTSGSDSRHQSALSSSTPPIISTNSSFQSELKNGPGYKSSSQKQTPSSREFKNSTVIDNRRPSSKNSTSTPIGAMNLSNTNSKRSPYSPNTPMQNYSSQDDSSSYNSSSSPPMIFSESKMSGQMKSSHNIKGFSSFEWNNVSNLLNQARLDDASLDESEFGDDNSAENFKSRRRASQNRASRNYRERKKAYINDLESKLEKLQLENGFLRIENQKFQHVIKQIQSTPNRSTPPLLRSYSSELQSEDVEIERIIVKIEQEVCYNNDDPDSLRNLLEVFRKHMAKRQQLLNKEAIELLNPKMQERLVHLEGIASNQVGEQISQLMDQVSHYVTSEQANQLNEIKLNHLKECSRIWQERKTINVNIKKFYQERIALKENGQDKTEQEVVSKLGAQLEVLKRNLSEESELNSNSIKTFSSILTPLQEALITIRHHNQYKDKASVIKMLTNMWGALKKMP